MVRWLRWHCPPDTGLEIRALAVWGRARYLSVTEAPHNTNFHMWMGKKQFCFFQTAETGNRTPDSGVKGSGANHYPRAPAQVTRSRIVVFNTTATSAQYNFFVFFKIWYLAENERENIAFLKYQLLKEFKKISFTLSIKSLCYSSPAESVVKGKTRCT